MQERAQQREAVTVTFTLNGQPATAVAAPVRVAGRHAARAAGPHRHQDRLRGGRLRRLHGDPRRRAGVRLPGGDGAGRRRTHRTVEGAGPRGLTDGCARAFLEHGAAQCGICTPGMLMAAADLLARTPAPGAAQVEDAIGGVLCRCTGYLKIVEAIMRSVAAVRPSPMREGQCASCRGSAPSRLRRRRAAAAGRRLAQGGRHRPVRRRRGPRRRAVDARGALAARPRALHARRPRLRSRRARQGSWRS